MAPLRLVNNSGMETERNLCFVNSALQLLYGVPKVRNFFVNEEYRINQDESANLKICDEVSRIFKSAGYTTSAATLRLLVGCESGNSEICDGSQQDITDFIRLLLEQIEAELTELDGPQALFINNFWGREHKIKKFADSSDGKCSKCGNLPRKEREDFNMLKLKVIKTNQELSLSSMVENSYSEGREVIVVRIPESVLLQTTANLEKQLIKHCFSEHRSICSSSFSDLNKGVILKHKQLLFLRKF